MSGMPGVDTMLPCTMRYLAKKIRTPASPESSEHVYHLYVIRVGSRDKIQARLEEREIQTLIHYPAPLPYLPAYKELKHVPADFPVAWAHKDEILSLPINPFLTDEEIWKVGEELNRLTL